MKCQKCDGTGKLNIIAHTFDAKTKSFIPEPAVQINCVVCHGTGQLSKQEAQEYQDYINSWCKCGNPSGEVSFYRNGRSHGYKCADCGKIVQEG